MASIKDGAANGAPTKKSEVKQMPLTFKTRDSLEMALYDFLKAKRNRGVFIKDLLINAMFKECPEIAASFGAAAAPATQPIQDAGIKIDPNPIIVQVKPQEGNTNSSTPNNTIEDKGDNSPPKVTRGKNTLNMF